MTLEPRKTRNRHWGHFVWICVMVATIIRILFLYRSSTFFETRKESTSPFPNNVTFIDLSTLAQKGPGMCEYSKGYWVPDDSPPLYTNQTCWQIHDTQNCLRNGRPDSKYLYWKWKPHQCEVLHADAKAFLESMRGKRLTFVGDSIARNQVQSLLCILTQVEKPTNTIHSENDRTNHWLFSSYSFSLTSYWSPYLVRQTSLQVYATNTTMMQLDLDVLDDELVTSTAGTDVLVISSGQWFFKSGVYKESGKILGCHNCPGTNMKEIGFHVAYRKAVRTVMKGLLSLPNFKGVILLRTFAPDHFENGQWDTGGTCSRIVPGGMSASETNKLMHEVEVSELETVAREVSAIDSARIMLFDITELAQLRPDGHPGPYRNFQPYSKDSKARFQLDCLHWCLPGPIDTWNEILMETVRQMDLENYPSL